MTCIRGSRHQPCNSPTQSRMKQMQQYYLATLRWEHVHIQQRSMLMWSTMVVAVVHSTMTAFMLFVSRLVDGKAIDTPGQQVILMPFCFLFGIERVSGCSKYIASTHVV
jgi:hypothetical protein